jgi:hypothetical protein
MAHLVSEQAAKQYDTAPPRSTVDAVRRLHTTIRDTLGSSYETFLEGSYKNDTAVDDLDVDIVAIRKNTTSTVFTGRPATRTISWDTIFDEVRNYLESSGYYRGKTARADKCITVNTLFTADVVPAVQIGDLDSDPIAIYSRKEGTERKNFPRIHYANGVSKHQQTSQLFKTTVRMFKAWVRHHFPGDIGIAPSFYLECLIYNFHDSAFLRDPVERFVHIASVIVSLRHGGQAIMTVAGDKNIFTETEWSSVQVERFQAELRFALQEAQAAIKASTATEALRRWRRAFNDKRT